MWMGSMTLRAILTQWQSWATPNSFRLHPDSQGRALYVLVEKILGTGERLNPKWPVHGTTGYAFLSLVNHLFVQTTHQTTD